jgi:hypothetical protein
MNTARPTLTRSIPFWALVVLSIAAVAFGAWFSLSQISTMTAGITDQTATAAGVYGAQSLVILGAAVLGAGLIGILLALTIAALRAFVPTQSLDVVEVADDDVHAGPWDAASTGEVAVASAPVAAPAATPAAAPVTTPVASTPEDAEPLTR